MVPTARRRDRAVPGDGVRVARAGRRGGTDDDPDLAEDELDVDDVDAVDAVDDGADDLEGTLEDDLVDDLGEEDDDELPEGFTVVGPEDAEPADDGDEALGRTVVPTVDDGDRAAAVLETAARGATPSEDDEEDDLAVQRAGEFVCSRCHLVKRDTQLARPRLLVCRDCA